MPFMLKPSVVVVSVLNTHDHRSGRCSADLSRRNHLPLEDLRRVLRSALTTPWAHYSRCSTARASPGSLETLSPIDIIWPSVSSRRPSLLARSCEQVSCSSSDASLIRCLQKPGLLEPVTVLKAADLAKGEELLREASKARTEAFTARFLVTDGFHVRNGLVAVKVSSRDPGLLSKMIDL